MPIINKKQVSLLRYFKNWMEYFIDRKNKEFNHIITKETIYFYNYREYYTS